MAMLVGALIGMVFFGGMGGVLAGIPGGILSGTLCGLFGAIIGLCANAYLQKRNTSKPDTKHTNSPTPPAGQPAGGSPIPPIDQQASFIDPQA